MLRSALISTYLYIRIIACNVFFYKIKSLCQRLFLYVFAQNKIIEKKNYGKNGPRSERPIDLQIYAVIK